MRGLRRCDTESSSPPHPTLSPSGRGSETRCPPPYREDNFFTRSKTGVNALMLYAKRMDPRVKPAGDGGGWRERFYIHTASERASQVSASPSVNPQQEPIGTE